MIIRSVRSKESQSLITKHTHIAPARLVSTISLGLWVVGSDGRGSLVTPSRAVSTSSPPTFDQTHGA